MSLLLHLDSELLTKESMYFRKTIPSEKHPRSKGPVGSFLFKYLHPVLRLPGGYVFWNFPHISWRTLHINHKLNLGFKQLPVFLQHPPFAEWLNQVPLHFSEKQRPSSFKHSSCLALSGRNRLPLNKICKGNQLPKLFSSCDWRRKFVSLQPGNVMALWRHFQWKVSSACILGPPNRGHVFSL